MDRDPARASLLARAFDYPYAAPRYPAAYGHGRLRALRSDWLASALPDDQSVRAVGSDGVIHLRSGQRFMPILAVGSNADRRVLFAKFGHRSGPLWQGPVMVHDHVCAHSAHVARYGALPATLVPHPGGQAQVWLQLVPLSWVADLDASEAVGVNYQRMPLDARVYAPWLPVRLSRAWTYASLHGPLRIRPAGHGALLSAGRVERAASPAVQRLGPQRTVLHHASRQVGWQGSLEDFVVTLVREPGLRRDVTACLKAL